MKIFYVFLIGFIILSCTKEVSTTTPASTPPSTTNDRLVFKNFKEYYDTYLMLAKFNSKEELSYWAQSKNHSTLLESSDSTIVIYSDVLKTILNKDSEFELGDSIVLFNNGDLYAYSKNESNQITFKNSPEKYKKIGSISVRILDGSIFRTVLLYVNTLNANNQHEFVQHSYQPCGGSKTWADGNRKYVHEILDESTITYPGPVYYSSLYLRIKLEYKVSRWRPASEQRSIILNNIQGSALWYPGGFGGNYGPINTSVTCWSGDAYVFLRSAVGADPWDTPYWLVSMTGTITHHVMGDDTNPAWVNGPNLW